MENITDIQKEITEKENFAKSLDIDIQFTKDKIHAEDDETHIIFLNDYLEMLKYELDRTNADLYILRKEMKLLEMRKSIN